MNIIQLNTLHLNVVLLNGDEMPGEVVVGGGEVVPVPPTEPETPDVPDVPVEPKKFILSASVTNGKVSALRNGSAVNLPFTANEGDTIVLEVTPNDGYTFEGWADGNTDNPRTITMTADVALSAECSEVVAPSKYIQFEDAEVERVLMSKGVSSDGVGITIEDAEKVTSISTWFKGNTAITSFEEFKYFKNCTTLEASAFEGCSNLASLPIEHIVVLNNKALYGCSALEYDNLNLANCTTLGQNALYGVKVRKLNISKVTTLPSANSSIQNYGDKSVLEEVVLGEVTKIPDYSFYAYESLKSINLGNVTYIGVYAFMNCVQLSIDIGELNPNMTNIGVASLIGVITTGDVTLPNLTGTVTWFNYNYPDAKLIEGIEDLGQATVIAGFNNQKKMRFAKLPSTTTKIDIDCFVGCTSLEYIVCWATTPPTLAHTSALKNTNNCPIYVPDASLEAYKNATNWVSYADRIHPLSEIEGSPYIQFEDAEVERVLMSKGVSSDGVGITKEDAANVTSISTWFKGNTAMTSFNELKYFTGVTELTANAMQNCSALLSANFDNIQYLRGSSLNNTGIDKMYLPSVKTIAGSALSSGKYSVILLGKNLTNIENYAIRINSILHTAICLAETPPTFGSGNFTSVNALTSVYVPDASVETYKTASGWSGVASKFKALSQLATDNPSLYLEIEKYL